MKSVLISFFIFIFSAQCVHAYPYPRMIGGPKYGFSYSAEGIVSFFKTDPRHSDPAVPRIGFGGEFRIHFYPSKNAHVQFGLEVVSQSCSFNTYYFAPGYSTIYDRSFGYTHTLRTMEMYLPIIGRLGLMSDESSARTIFFVMGGYSPKIFLSASSNVVQNSTGNGIWGGPTTLAFENHLLGTNINHVLMAGFGFEKRFGFSERFLTFESMFKYDLSRFIYTGKVDTNTLFIKDMCISLQVGYRFAAGGRSKGVD
ncbi:MAG: hypothetical protein HY064_08765 [Bacteroidetes bacterium]|nr:hypothetical protein [Bacteroidota bacterium]